MGDAGLDDEIGLNRPDQLLNALNVLGILDDRSTRPGEIIGIAFFGRPGQGIRG